MIKIDKKCPDRFHKNPMEQHCIGVECVAFRLHDIRDPPLWQPDSIHPNPDSKVVARLPGCNKYNNWVGPKILVVDEKS